MPTNFDINDSDLVLDALPDDVVASMEVRDRTVNDIGLNAGVGLEFVLEDVLRWRPGQVVKVAFLDGTSALHADIMDAVQEIVAACNIKLDFGRDDNGNFRRWTENDTTYAADIRVSFDKPGYFSLVGTDSINPTIGPPLSPVGGRAKQCSLNLGGYMGQRPTTWRGTVRHEFLHALGFHHSHQNMRGPCQAAFRWDDDPGYRPTQDHRGTFIPDAQGRRPGIYTFLAGYPNNWNRAKVDHNLKTEENPNVIIGPFDRASVMLYRFPDSFYKTVPSPCAPVGEGQSLSEQDKRGLRVLYPHTAGEVEAVVEAQRSLAEAIDPDGAGDDAAMGLESVDDGGAAPNEFLRAAASILKRNLSAV